MKLPTALNKGTYMILEVIARFDPSHNFSTIKRYEIEDHLNESLEEHRIGTVAGSIEDSEKINFQIELYDEKHFQKGLKLIRTVLKHLKVPDNAFVQRTSPEKTVYPVYEK
jgi:hypothetical protein